MCSLIRMCSPVRYKEGLRQILLHVDFFFPSSFVFIGEGKKSVIGKGLFFPLQKSVQRHFKE